MADFEDKVRADREGVGAWHLGSKSRGAKSLRPDLRMANSEDGRTSYWQGPEQTRQSTARTVFQALRGSPALCVSCSKARPQVIWPHEICRRLPTGYALSLSSLLFDKLFFMFL